MPDRSNIVAFRPRPPTADDPRGGNIPALRRRRAHPSTSLALILRSAPDRLQPIYVARDMLKAGSNAAAGPIWTARRSEFRKLLASRRIAPAEFIRLFEEFRAAVRAQGIAQKAARRQGEAAAFRVFEKMGEEQDLA